MTRSRLLKLSLWALGLIIVYGILGFAVVPAIAKRVIVKQVAAQLHREATIAGVAFNPFSLAARVRGFAVSDPIGPKPELSFDELDVNVSFLGSLYRRAPVLSAFRLAKPYVSIIRTEDGRYNFSDILDQALAQPAKPASTASSPSMFSLNNIEIVDGTVEFDDRLQHAHNVVSDIQFAVPLVSDLPAQTDQYVTPHFAAKVNGEPIVMNARSKPFEADLDTTLDLNAQDIDIPRYLQYVPLAAEFKLASATLGLHLSVHFVRSAAGKPPAIQLDGGVDLTNVSVTELDGTPMLKVPALNVRIGRFDLSGDQLVLDEVRLPGTEITVRRAADGTINLAKLARVQLRSSRPGQTGSSAGAPAGAQSNAAGKSNAGGQSNTGGQSGGAASPPLSVIVKSVVVSNASVDVGDAATGSSPFHTRLSPIDIKLTQVSYPRPDPGQLELSIANDRGVRVSAASAFTISPLSAKGSVTLTGFKPKDYAAYWRNAVAFDFDEGSIDAGTSYDFRAGTPAAAISTSDMKLAVQSLRMSMRADKSEILRIRDFEVAGGSVDLTAHTAAIGQVALRGGVLMVKRTHDGVINLTQLVADGGAGTKGTGTATPMPAGGGAEGQPAGQPAATSPGQSPPWSWKVDSASLNGFGVRFTDEVPESAASVRIEPIDFSVTGLSSAAGAKARVQLKTRVNQTGTVAASARLSVNPLAADGTFDVQSIDLTPYQPYVGQFVNVALSSGQFNAHGTVSFAGGDGAPARTQLKTSVTVTDFACTDTATSQDLLHWKSLNLGDIALDTAPMSVAINDIALAEFYSRLILNADGHFNLQGLMHKPADAAANPAAPANPEPPPNPAPPPAPAAEASPAPASDGAAAAAASPGGGARITIGRVSLEAGHINFSDFFIKPNYTANLTDLTGTVTALTPEAPGHVDVRGKVDGSAPLDIEGDINPLAKLLFLDIKAEAHDIQLSPMTPYTAKYIGYGIEKGTLSLKLAYKVDNNQLSASNNVYLDQLTFGKPVESPTATKLPVLLAIALLKDRNGVINVDVPISGSLNDPQFSLGGVILHVIVNLVVKAVTSPFALLSSVFGGSGEELSHVAFDPGKADLNDASTHRLDILAKALKERPALRLDISGRVDPPTDREALRHIDLERSVKAQKFKDLLKSATPVASVDDVTVAPDEYEKYLTQAYRATSFPKPRNALGFLRDLPVPDMEKLMLTSADITEGDLSALAESRAQAAQSYLVNKAGIDAGRVFLVAPKLNGDDVKDSDKKTRADFNLQ